MDGWTVGAVIGTILQPEAMWPLWVGAAGTAAGVTTGIRDYKEFSTVDLGAQAQEGGAGSLTSKSKEEARFDLMMGQANLLMAGLDVGMTAKGTVGLLKGSTKMGASLSKVKPAALAQVFNDVANEPLHAPNVFQYCSVKPCHPCISPPDPPILGGESQNPGSFPPRIGGLGGQVQCLCLLTEQYCNVFRFTNLCQSFSGA